MFFENLKKGLGVRIADLPGNFRDFFVPRDQKSASLFHPKPLNQLCKGTAVDFLESGGKVGEAVMQVPAQLAELYIRSKIFLTVVIGPDKGVMRQFVFGRVAFFGAFPENGQNNFKNIAAGKLQMAVPAVTVLPQNTFHNSADVIFGIGIYILNKKGGSDFPGEAEQKRTGQVTEASDIGENLVDECG